MILKLLAFVTTTLIIRCDSVWKEPTSKPSLPKDLQELLDSLYMTGYIPEYILPEDELTETEKTEGEYLDFPELKNAQDDVFVPPESEYSKNHLHYKNIKPNKRLIPDRNKKLKVSRLHREIQKPEELRSDLIAPQAENFTKSKEGKEQKSNTSIKLDFLIPIPERGVYASNIGSTEICNPSELSGSNEFGNSIERKTELCIPFEHMGTTEQFNARQTQCNGSRQPQWYNTKLIGHSNLATNECLGQTGLLNPESINIFNSEAIEIKGSKSTRSLNSRPNEHYDAGQTEPMNNKEINPQPTLNSPNQQESWNTPNPQAILNTLNPQGYLNALNPQGYLNTLNPQGYLNTPSPQGFLNTANPHGFLNTPNLQGFLNTLNPQGFLNTSNPQEYLNTTNPQGFLNTPNPRGSLRILSPRPINIPNPPGSIKTPNPLGYMRIINPQVTMNIPTSHGSSNIPNQPQKFMDLSPSTTNCDTLNKDCTQSILLHTQNLFTAPELPNMPRYPGFNPNTTLRQPLTFEIISPKTEKSIDTFHFTVAIVPQPNVTIKPTFEKQLKNMLIVQQVPKQLLPQFVHYTKQPEKTLRTQAMDIKTEKKFVRSSAMPRMNRTIHPSEQRTMRTSLDNSSRSIDLKTIDKNIATNVVSLMADSLSINKMEGEGAKAGMKPSISVSNEVPQNVEAYFDRQPYNTSDIPMPSNINGKNKERKDASLNSLSNTTGKETVDTGRPKKKMFTFLSIFKKNKKFPLDTPSHKNHTALGSHNHSTTQRKRETMEDSYNELYGQLFETDGINDNSDIQSQFLIGHNLEEETFNHKRKKK